MSSRNLFEVPPLTIHQAVVEMTLFDGRVIYEREDFKELKRLAPTDP